MKILRIIADVDPRSGGPLEGLRLSGKKMALLGHETEVVTLRGSTHADFDFPFPVHTCGPGRGKYGYTPELANWIEKNGSRFDAAVIHGLWNHASIGGWQGLRRTKLPYVVFTHGMMDPWFRDTYPLKHLAKQLFWWAAQGKVLRDAEAVLFTSEEERVLARGVFHGYAYTERVVAYGAAEPGGRAEQQRDAFHRKVPKLGDKPYLLFLSRIHEKKGCDLLVKAYASLAAQYPEIDLVIAGPDQVGLQAELTALAAEAGVADRIHWPGMLGGDAKWGAFRGADAFVLPSHQENFGIVVAEAMACGTPVLITDKVNIWREVKASGGGLVAPDTQDGVTRLLSEWLASAPDQKRTMGLNARAGFERYFHLDSAARDLTSALADAAAKDRRK